MQPRQRTHPLVLALAVALAAVGAALALMAFTYPEHFREYRLYLTQRRPALDFRFDELSETWGESDLRQRFPGARIDCYQDTSAPALGDKRCYIDVSSHNGTRAMVASFFFQDDRLGSASLTIPWWGHEASLRSILRLYGRPSGFQAEPVAGVRLVGWRLADGSALFFNRDRELNPVKWSAIYWSSQRSCIKSGCFTEGRVGEL
jgi:hypothetical protein